MGRPEEQRGKQTLAVAVDIEGNANYDAIVRQGARANKVIHTGHQALIPKVDLLDPQVWEDGDQTDRVYNSVGAAVESVSVLQAQWAEKAAGAASACHTLLAEGGI
jgi:SNW domain-containing protein 1